MQSRNNLKVGRRNQRVMSTLCFAVMTSFASNAQVVTDGTMGQALSLTGPNFRIDEVLGTRSGDNLFHSFSQFNLQAGHSATFTGADDIANVISRITGQDPSVIQGLLKSEIGNADFYFINPNGVVFTGNARVDVPAGFYLSTAQQIIFDNGDLFSAETTAPSTLSVSAPAQFGFLGNQGSIVVEDTNIKFETGGVTHFSANDVRFANAKTKVDNGTAVFVAVGAGETQQRIASPTITADGSITFENAELKIENDGGGTIHLSASDIGLTQSALIVNNTGATDNAVGIRLDGGNIFIDNSYVSTATLSIGRAGDIMVTANNFTMTGDSSPPNQGPNSATSQSDPDEGPGVPDLPGPPDQPNPAANQGAIISVESRTGSGTGGDIVFDVSGDMQLVNEAHLSTATRTGGDAGRIEIKAGNLSLDTSDTQHTASISTFTSNSGKGGDITLDVEQGVTLRGNALISASTLGDGNAGDMFINANSLLIEETEESIDAENGVGIESLSGLRTDIENAPQGSSGSIHIDVHEDVQIINGGYIVSITVGNGHAGNINIDADNLFLESAVGKTANIIGSNTLGPTATGDAGDIFIDLDGTFEMLGNTFVSTTAVSKGNAGDMHIKANRLFMLGNGGRSQSGINSSTVGEMGAGNAGNIFIDIAEDIVMKTGANISSDTRNNGNAGNVNISAGSLTMVGDKSDFDTGISSSAASERPVTGNAGNITLNIDGAISMVGEAGLKTESESLGNAGNISITGGSLFMSGAELESKAEGEIFHSGSAGDIDITLSGDLVVADGSQINSDSFRGQNAGNISITANNLKMLGIGEEGHFSSITSTAALTQANAGNISLNIANAVVMQEGANIVSDSVRAGQAGEINIVTSDLTMNGMGLPTRISSTSINGQGDAGEINIIANGGISLINGGQITSSTLNSGGSAGEVNIQTNNLYIDAQNNFSLEAFAELIRQQLAEEVEEIPDDIRDLPPGGALPIDDDLIALAAFIDVQVNGRLETGITSISGLNATGNAGVINIDASNIELAQGGVINTSSLSSGNAGNIGINTGTLTINSQNQNPNDASGIFSRIYDGTGQAGTININASEAINLFGGKIGIESLTQEDEDNAQNAIGAINIVTQSLTMRDRASISSQSRGSNAASAISITANDRIDIEHSQITTSAENANAGQIDITTSELYLDSSVVTTSVTQDGNGGNIDISSSFILLETGFIQGNTGGENFSGGDITINSDFLIVSNQSLTTSSDERQVFVPDSGKNVIQAAAPDGVSGTVNIGALEFDLSGELAGFNAEILNINPLKNNPCVANFGSSLGTGGRGGQALKAGDLSVPPLTTDAITQRITAMENVSVENEALLTLQKPAQGRSHITCHQDVNPYVDISAP